MLKVSYQVNSLTLTSWGSTLESQILWFKVNPRTVRVKILIMVVDS